jgi:DHA1 family inner membrane transport protein
VNAKKVGEYLTNIGTDFIKNPGKMLLPSLVISRFATMPPGILTGLLLLDIGETFGYTVGVTGQIITGASIIGVISAIMISVLSLRFTPKFLLVGGLILLVVSTVGCIFAPTFSVLIIIYALTGMAGSFVGPMAFTLVADNFSPQERANALSWIIAGMSGAYLIGSPIIGYISGFVGWRGSFLWFVLPISLIGLLLAIKFIPSEQQSSHEEKKTQIGIIDSYKRVLSNISALACLVGSALIAAAYMAMVSYAPSFFREQFGLSTAQASFIVIGYSVFFITGTRLSGRLIKRFGRKTMMLWPTALASLTIFAYLNITNLWLSMLARFLGSAFSAVVFTAVNALTLEQVPNLRGTVMSLNQATFSLGGVLGTGFGGLVVLLYGYQTMGLSHGAFMFIAMLILHFLAKEPNESS